MICSAVIHAKATKQRRMQAGCNVIIHCSALRTSEARVRVINRRDIILAILNVSKLNYAFF
jgi:hypothetical protein